MKFKRKFAERERKKKLDKTQLLFVYIRSTQTLSLDTQSYIHAHLKRQIRSTHTS